MICDVTSWGSHRCLLERAIINIQALGNRTNPSVLWLKSDVNINKNSTFAIKLYLLYFFIVKNDHGTFFNGRIRFLVRSNGLRIHTGTR